MNRPGLNRATLSRLLCCMALIAVLLMLSLGSSAAPLVFESPAQEQRFNDLVYELRCVVCQNQNLADSDAPLAADLRQLIFQQMQAGKSDAEIKQHMIERYGEFVLYNPPLKTNTVLLWAAPLLMVLVGTVLVFTIVRQRSRQLHERSDEYAEDEH